MNKLDTFNNDKFKCFDCKQYFDKKEVNSFPVSWSLSGNVEVERLNFCFDCYKKFIESKGYKSIQVDGNQYVFNDRTRTVLSDFIWAYSISNRK